MGKRNMETHSIVLYVLKFDHAPVYDPSPISADGAVEKAENVTALPAALTTAALSADTFAVR